LGGAPQKIHVSGAPEPVVVPAAVVKVDDAPGGQLTLVFRSRVAPGNTREIAVPSGLIRFVVHGDTAGHDVRIEGVPAFDADFTAGVLGGAASRTITQDVQLTPGTYTMYCAIPGHQAAGEQVHIDVTPMSREQALAAARRQNPHAQYTAKYTQVAELDAADGRKDTSTLLTPDTPVWVVATGDDRADPQGHFDWFVSVFDAQTGARDMGFGSTTTALPAWWRGLPDRATG
jgi:hypothetical protein